MHMSSYSVTRTDTPAIKNAPLVGLAEGNGSFNNLHLAALVLGVPWLVKRILPIVSRGGFKTYIFMVLLLGVPVTVAYWTLMSMYGPRKNTKVQLPGRNIEEYITIHDEELKAKYHGKERIPMQIFYDAYFEGKIDFNGDVLDIMEQRHDWAKMVFTPELFKYVFFNLIPDVLRHERGQDEEQVRDTYDRGDDFYEWFLGPRMVYTSGIVSNLEEEETLEKLQDNKLTVVCEKLDLGPDDRLLDIGCGWGTLCAFAAKNYDCASVTGLTLARNQAKFGNERIQKNGGDPNRHKILCADYRDMPGGKGAYTKIVSLEMAEHVGIRRYQSFLKQIYDLLEDDGVFLLQVAGLRPHWQYEDLIWGLFMNKYIFPGADASCSLGWVVSQVEKAGFEVKNIDVFGVHYSATIWRWYKNWLANKDKVIENYGERWYRIWVFFLAYSVIIARHGGSSVFQLTLHKNLNAYPRILGLPSHNSLHVNPRREIRPVE
ncbi:cyclopropane fatty acid synthase domain-containing protein [Daedalea quercina L-15889]|uniref:sphingolipid C(9)-methyltransferase n=1 Tax=Daedalea quercina L-15889 TaxID=1314783 RepID=A0A165LT62_9APHY|nr:cyclopropane fatty acid synthase domain-containing protein [Daedalea quercina L-15889]